jgi:hypothetical protein
MGTTYRERRELGKGEADVSSRSYIKMRDGTEKRKKGKTEKVPIKVKPSINIRCCHKNEQAMTSFLSSKKILFIFLMYWIQIKVVSSKIYNRKRRLKF